jgi:hypothetical protein
MAGTSFLRGISDGTHMIVNAILIRFPSSSRQVPG